MRRSWLPWLDERDRDLMEEADAEYAMNEKEYQDWLNRQWDRAEDEVARDPNAYNPDDPYDNSYLVGERERGRL